MTVSLMTGELDGKKIAYSSETEFLVQVGRYAKGSYKTRYSFKGNLARAVMFYTSINLGNGYKKRLVFVGGKPKEVLARATS